jgi:uncharacterized membrane protein required for colicin V production
MNINWVDILFLITVILLVLSGLRNGFLFSLINLISIPIGLAVAFYYGPRLTSLLAANNLAATPLIAYIVLFFGTILVLHIIGTWVRGFVKHIPVIGCADGLLGGAIGFVEAWLIWLILLVVLHNFLNGLQSGLPAGAANVPGLNVPVEQLRAWHDFYNQAVTNSLFARVNSFFVQQLPGLPRLTRLL